jgi:hypothetical protein
MPKGKLRIVKPSHPSIGVCERCNAQFKGDGIQAPFGGRQDRPVALHPTRAFHENHFRVQFMEVVVVLAMSRRRLFSTE